MLRPARETHALIALAALTVIWGSNWIVMKQALLYSGPFEFAAVRAVFATIVLFGVLLLCRQSLRPPPLPATVAIGLAQTLGFQALVQWALVEGGAGKTALLAYTMPFWVIPLAWTILGERVSRRHGVAIVVAAVGLLLVVRPWLGLGGLRSVTLALVAGLCWALGVVLTKRLFRRAAVGALSLTAWQMLFGTFGLLLLVWMVPEPPMQWTPYLIGALAYNSILASGLAWVLWAAVVDRLPTHVAGLTSLIIPIVGIGFAWILLGEQPDAAEFLGITLIAAGLFALIAPRREADPTINRAR